LGGAAVADATDSFPEPIRPDHAGVEDLSTILFREPLRQKRARLNFLRSRRTTSTMSLTTSRSALMNSASSKDRENAPRV